MNIYKFEKASKLRDYVRDYNSKKIKQEIKRVKTDMKKAAKEGEDYLNIFFADINTAREIYAKITPELIYKGYEVSCSYTTVYKSIKISWKRGGVGPYQVEERMQEYYKTLREIKKYADDSN